MLFIISIFLTSVFAADYVQWQKTGNFAKTTLKGDDNGMTTLSKTTEPGARFLYTKLISDAKSAPLVTVYLINTDLKLNFSLQTQFDTITQECSCYWLDVNKLESEHDKLVTAEKYQIQFKGGDMYSVSGYFGLKLSRDPVETTTVVPQTGTTVSPKTPTLTTVTKIVSSSTMVVVETVAPSDGDMPESKKADEKSNKSQKSGAERVAAAGMCLLMGAAALF